MRGFPYRARPRSCTLGIPVQKPRWWSSGSGVGLLSCSSLGGPMEEEIHSLVLPRSWTLNKVYMVWKPVAFSFSSLGLGGPALFLIPKAVQCLPPPPTAWTRLRYYHGCPVSLIIIFFAPSFETCNCRIACSNLSRCGCLSLNDTCVGSSSDCSNLDF